MIAQFVRQAHNKLHTSLQTDSRGDTIVEVIVATVVISMMVVTGFMVTRSSLAATTDSQEHSEAAKLLQGQVELLRAGALSDDSDTFTATPPKAFCVKTVSSKQTPVALTGAAATGLPAIDDDPLDTSDYPTDCTKGLYHISIVPPTSPDTTYILRARWDARKGGKNEVVLRYRIPQKPLAAAPPCSVVTNDIVLVFDTSETMDHAWQTGTRIEKLQEVAAHFVQNTNVGPVNHEAIISFDASATLRNDFTENTAALTNSINSLTTHLHTRYMPALNRATNVFTGANSRASAKKIMVFISDGIANDFPGNPLLTRSTIVAKTDSMKADGNIIYTIGINTDAGALAILQDMAGNGGTFTNAQNESDLTNIMDTIATSLACT